MKKLLTVATLVLIGLTATTIQAAEPLKILTWKGYAPQQLVDKFEQEPELRSN